MKRRTSRFALVAALLAPLVITGPATAIVLGPIGNVGLLNPNQISAEGDGFGVATATGDFNGDSIDDLAVGIPGNACAGQINAGSVMVLRGRDDLNGLDAQGVSYWSQSMAGVIDSCEAGDRFGSALAAGSLTTTPLSDPVTDDLAVGVPGEALDGVTLAGAVAILPGSTNGITATGNLLIDESQLPGGALALAAFGSRIAIGRIDDSPGNNDSLIVASPLATQAGLTVAGRVWVLPGFFAGLALTRAGQLSLSPAYSLAPGASVDAYGSQLAIGDFNGDDENDLAIGVPGYDSPASGSGAVQVVYQSKFLFVDGFDD